MKGGSFLAIGAVVRPHGVQGKIRVRYEGDDPQHFPTLQEIRLGNHPKELTTHRILHMQPYNRGLFILTLEAFTLANAQGSVGQCVWVRRDQLPPLEEDEYYWADLIGLRVVTEEGQELGVVRGLLSTGSNDVLACHSESGEVLVPFIDEVVLRVDPDAGAIHVRLVEGLI